MVLVEFGQTNIDGFCVLFRKFCKLKWQGLAHQTNVGEKNLQTRHEKYG